MNDLIERLEKARDFPHNTCGASRHVQMLGEILSKGRTPPAFAEEPQHIGESMLATVAALYEARTEIRSAADTIERLEAENARLTDPVAVHVNMLAGKIAKPSVKAIRHLYPELEAENARLRAALEEIENTDIGHAADIARAALAGGEAFKAMTFVEPKQWYEG